ncbi:MAG TPA: hypothetical protein VK666_23020 [Chryseolinea sp.]|nr:hypothetical protein [Chryseolinea sp.]
MATMFSIAFNYRGNNYHAISRIKEKSNRRECHVTIMNGTLEKILYGYHVFICEDGHLISKAPVACGELALLQGIVLKCLHGHPLLNTTELHTNN